MAPKRAAEKQLPRASKAPKVDPFAEAMQSILDIMSADDSLTESVYSVLCTTAPFALRPAKGDRHQFQAKLAETLGDILKNVEVSKNDAVQAAQDKVAQLEAEREVKAGALPAICQQVDERQQAMGACDAALKEAVATHDASQKAHAALLEVMASLEAENARNMAAKAEREKLLTEDWAQLRDSTMEGTSSGQLWRKKNKTIDSIAQTLTELGVERSCTESLALALKEKPEQRGKFATRCVEYAEEQLQRSLQEISDKIDANVGDISEKAKEVEKAAAMLKEVEADRDDKQNKVIEADNKLLEATEERSKFDGEIKEFDLQAKELAVALATAQEDQDQARSGLVCFENLLEHGELGTATATAPAPQAPKEEEASGAVPMAQEGEVEMAVAPTTQDAEVPPADAPMQQKVEDLSAAMPVAVAMEVAGA